MFLSCSFCHSQVVEHLEIDKLSINCFRSVHHSFRRKTLDTIVELHFCQNSLVQLLIFAYNYQKQKVEKNKSLTIELVT